MKWIASSSAASAVLLGLPLVVAFAAPGAHAEDFYQNKELRLIVGFPAGNDYDLGARLLAKYLSKYLPGQPTIIVQNLPQAASVAAANALYAQVARDGTVLGSFSRNIVNDALTGLANLKADPRRFVWLGSTSRPRYQCYSAGKAGAIFARALSIDRAGPSTAPGTSTTLVHQRRLPINNGVAIWRSDSSA